MSYNGSTQASGVCRLGSIPSTPINSEITIFSKDMARKALLVMDMVNEYVYGGRPLIRVAKRRQLIANIQSAIRWARKKKIPIIYINSAFRKNDPILNVIGHRAQAMKGSNGAQIITELVPEKRDYLLEKRGYDGFWKSGLDKLLKKLNVQEIHLAGQQTDCCVRETGVTAVHLGYKVFILGDCCDTNRPMGQQSALRFMKTCVGKIITLKNL